jgi:hypothetical protein
MSNHNSVASQIQSLAAKAVEIANGVSSEIPRETVPYIIEVVENFQFSKTNSSFQKSFRTEERQELPLAAEDKIFRDRIRTLPEFESCAASIRATYGRDDSADRLQRFLTVLISRHLRASESVALIDDVVAFIGDLQDAPVFWSVTARLVGVWLNCDKIEVPSGYVLRRPVASDFEHKRRSDLSFAGTEMFEPIPSAVLEFKWKAVGSIEVQSRVEIVVAALRLFRFGAVRYVGYSLSCHSFSRHGFTIGPAMVGSSEVFELDEGDAAPLATFLDVIIARLPRDYFPGSTPATKVAPVGVALERYRDALTAPMPVEGQIAMVVSCLEALYLKAEERSELTHRLSQRASVLLAAFGEKHPIKAYENLARAYDIRSTYIHGAALSPDESASAQKLRPKIIDYARISLVAFLQLKAPEAKDTILNRIDNSLLESGCKKNLDEQLAAMVYFPRRLEDRSGL